MTRAWRLVLLGTLAAGVALAPPVEAQRGPPDRRGGGQDRERLEQRVREQMGRMMRERLGLDESQAQRLSEVVEGFTERRRDLFRAEQATRRRVEAFTRADVVDESSPAREAEARQLVERMAELRASEAALFAEEQQALLEVLSPVQLLRFHALREQIGQRIRSLSRGRDGDRGDARRRGRRGAEEDNMWTPPGQR